MEREMSKLREPQTSLKQEIVLQVLKEYQKASVTGTELRRERAVGSKDGTLVSGCIDIGHSRPW